MSMDRQGHGNHARRIIEIERRRNEQRRRELSKKIRSHHGKGRI